MKLAAANMALAVFCHLQGLTVDIRTSHGTRIFFRMF